jgi:hypothetical protein
MPDRTDRQGRRRPFSTWVKKLTNFKSSSSGDGSRLSGSKRSYHMKVHAKQRPSKNNNPYPQSGRIGQNHENQVDTSVYSFSTARSGSATSLERPSIQSSLDGRAPPTAGARSMAPTVSTDHETSRSITAPSHGASSITGTSRTIGGGFDGRRGGDSTFSSPAPSVRSLTTTLTTIQSMAPNGTHVATNTQGHTTANPNNQSLQFHQPFPTASPASAIPAHLAPNNIGAYGPGYPTTYTTATANNLLTDNASILTLASSSKGRRRRSLDTNASVRALAPSSLWGGSRESLPLSVLSANIDAMPTTPGLHQNSSRMGAAERTSIYSATGVVPPLPSDRNSFYAKQSAAGDTASVRSGLLGHGRAESISGSISGLTSPLASPREMAERSGVDERDDEDT